MTEVIFLKKKDEKVYNSYLLQNCKDRFSPDYVLESVLGTYCLASPKYGCCYQRESGKYLKKCERW